MDPEKQKEEFSNAFVQAAAAVAGFSMSKPSVDDDSIDWCLHDRGGAGTVRSPRLELQLKSTANPTFVEADLRYDLKVKNYHDLIPEDVMVPRILVVVALRDIVGDWHHLDDERLLLRSCAYWVSLRGYASTANLHTITVRLPIVQRFDGVALGAIMDRVRNGRLP